MNNNPRKLVPLTNCRFRSFVIVIARRKRRGTSLRSLMKNKMMKARNGDLCGSSPGPFQRWVGGASLAVPGVLLVALWLALSFPSPLGAASSNGFDLSNSTVPLNAVQSGGPPRDGIPAIDRPKFVAAHQARFMRAEDLVLSVTLEGQTRAYPLRILVWHEIVNDRFGDRFIVVTYCPLCGTAMAFDRRIQGRTLSFGVSGLLYQSDVLLYDRQTESLWTQLGMKSISGPLVGTPLPWLASEQLTFAAWRQKYPQGLVLSTDTGFRQDYARNPYQDYEQRGHAMFPVPMRRKDLPEKEWVVGILVNGVPKAYPVAWFTAKTTFQDRLGDTAIEFSYDPVSRHASVKQAATGEPIPQVMVYWFAWQAFYPETELWQRP